MKKPFSVNSFVLKTSIHSLKKIERSIELEMSLMEVNKNIDVKFKIVQKNLNALRIEQIKSIMRRLSRVVHENEFKLKRKKGI